MSSDPKVPADASDALGSLDPVTREAVEKLVRLNSGEATDRERREYEAWRESSSERRAAAERAEQLWKMLGTALKRPPGRSPRRFPVIALLALGLAGAAFAAGLFGPPAALFADETTGVGERRTVTLADGSRVELDTRTSLDVDEGGRRLTLYAGQIFVTVARDPTRPFTVRSGDGAAQALGTAFNVRRDDETTTVAVAEGIVRVTSTEPGAVTRVADVAAGREVAYAPGAPTLATRLADLRERTGWRAGELRFHGRPLGEVMEEFGRYRRGVVLFTDERLRRLPVTGVFRVENAEGALNAIAPLAPVKIRRLPWLIVIQSDPARAGASAR